MRVGLVARTRCWVLGLLIAAVVIPLSYARAADQPTARDFVNDIYKAYQGNADTAKGNDLADAALARYFEPALVKLIMQDRRDGRRRGEVPKLDGDPFVDSQEWDIEDLHIAVRGTGSDKARGTVSFKNFGKPIAILVDLAKLDEGWRIRDIRWDTRRTLRRLLGAR
jgi:hypothetical protein